MKIDEIAKYSLLHDLYGKLLTDRQRKVMGLYHEENLSLSEIASELSISRQGVHDALKNAEKSLDDYEKKLRLLGKLAEGIYVTEKIGSMIDEVIDMLEAWGSEDSDPPVARLKEIKEIVREWEV